MTGETVTFVLLLAPDAFLPAAHVHPSQEEAFTVLAGVLRFSSGGVAEVVRVGGSLVVPAGSPHSWGPDGDVGARVRVVFTPPR